MIGHNISWNSGVSHTGRAGDVLALSERLLCSATSVQVFHALSDFAREHGFDALIVDVTIAPGAVRREQWHNVGPALAAAYAASGVAALLEERLADAPGPVILAWSVQALPGFFSVFPAQIRAVLAAQDMLGGIYFRMQMASGRIGRVHLLADAAPRRLLDADFRDNFRTAAIHSLLALDRALGAMPPAALTARETEALRLAARGLAIREIAAAMAVSEATVKFHLSGARRKLGVRTTRNAVAMLSTIKID